MKKGDIVGSVKIRNHFDAYAMRVLSSSFREVESTQNKSGKRGQRKYKIVADLPSKTEYIVLRNKHFTTNVSDLISDAFSEIESLGSEMRDWYDGMPENFQNGDKGSAVNDAADALESMESPSVESTGVSQILERITVVHLPGLNVSSRSDRAIDAADMLRTASEAIDEWVSENMNDKESNKTIEFEEDGEKVSITVDFESLTTLSSEAMTAAEDLEGVEFPGMYG
jgi:hypothetical protein